MKTTNTSNPNFLKYMKIVQKLIQFVITFSTHISKNNYKRKLICYSLSAVEVGW